LRDGQIDSHLGRDQELLEMIVEEPSQAFPFSSLVALQQRRQFAEPQFALLDFARSLHDPSLERRFDSPEFLAGRGQLPLSLRQGRLGRQSFVCAKLQLLIQRQRGFAREPRLPLDRERRGDSCDPPTLKSRLSQAFRHFGFGPTQRLGFDAQLALSRRRLHAVVCGTGSSIRRRNILGGAHQHSPVDSSNARL